MKIPSFFATVAVICFGQVAMADNKSDNELKILASRTKLMVTGRAVSKPELSPIGVGYLIFDFRFQATQVLKGVMPTSKKLFVEFDAPKDYRSEPYKLPTPPVKVGIPYILFLHDKGAGNIPRWKVVGIRPYSYQLVKKLRQLHAL